jgi:glycogen debranching enzyme
MSVDRIAAAAEIDAIPEAPFHIPATDLATRARCTLKYGNAFAVERIFRGLFDAASYMELRRLPELFCGFQRQRSRGPTLYPVACSPQAWASGTPFTLLEASLGLEFDQGNQEIRLRNPTLPAFLDEVMLRNVQLGGQSSVDLRLRRHKDEVSVDVPRRRGDIQVSVVFSR